MILNYGRIINNDIANGAGVRVSLFVSGCRNHCSNCFNPDTWDFGYGTPFTEETEGELIKMLALPQSSGLSLLGGEPLEPENQRALLPFLRRLKAILPQKTIWCWTGFTYEELMDTTKRCRCEVTDELLALLEVLVDGRYTEELKDLRIRFRGSSNQRIIDIQKTLRNGAIVLFEE